MPHIDANNNQLKTGDTVTAGGVVSIIPGTDTVYLTLINPQDKRVSHGPVIVPAKMLTQIGAKK